MRSISSPRSGRSSSAAEAPAAKNAAASSSAPPGAESPAMRIGLPRGLQIIREEVVGDLAAHRFAYFERGAEVNAAPDAHLFVLFHHLPDAGEAALQARVGNVGCGEARGPGPENRFEYGRRGTGVGSRLGRILRMHRRSGGRRPAGVAV